MQKIKKSKEEKKESELIQYNEDGKIFLQRAKDGYLFATAMCKAHGKKWYDYLRLSTTQSFIEELSESAGIPAGSMVQSCTTGPRHLRGTWIHPKLAIHLAQWLSPRFAVRVSYLVFDWMTGKVEPSPSIWNDPKKLMSRALELVSQMEDVHRLRIENEELKNLAGQNSNYYGVLRYNEEFGMGWPEKRKGLIGKKITEFCRTNNCEIRRVIDPRYGEVNAYPLEAWNRFRSICQHPERTKAEELQIQ